MSTEKNTPLMEQYFAIREQYPDAVLFFQVGDFYEMFFDDAKKVSAFLALTLTKRGKNKGEDIPLCGIPVHALNHYLPKLVKGGFKVAVCDQLTKPSPGTVVERGVTQVLSPGTLTDSMLLDEKSASYLLSFFPGQDRWGLIFSELMTAQLFATTIPSGEERMVETELIRFFPDEIILPADKNYQTFSSYFKKMGYYTSPATLAYNLTTTDDIVGVDMSKLWLEKQFDARALNRLKNQPALTGGLANLHGYLLKNQAPALEQIKTIHFYEPEDYLILDSATQRNLEIVTNNQDGGRKNTLLQVLDQAKTPMGSRLVKKWLLRPLVQKTAILQRQEAVGAIKQQLQTSAMLEDLLSEVADLERIIGRIALDRAIFNDYLGLKNSLLIMPKIKTLLATQLLYVSLALAIQERIHDFSALVEFLNLSLNDEPETDHIIRKGFDFEFDRLNNLLVNGQQEILKLEQKEISRTGISSLKIRYNQVSGYYIEITNANLESVPEDYTQQNTLVNRKRFVTQELKALERDMLRAQTEIEEIEKTAFARVKREVASYLGQLRQLAGGIAHLDALLSLAKAAYNNNYVAPTFNEQRNINITEGRHPIIEQKLNQGFIKNDTALTDQESLWIITGPNMGGKSTYLRQVALISIMAQCGSFVPASNANLSILDRIFTRIGSADNLAEGKSTFLVEMEETATICTQATSKSLVILDEVGRGTSTFDGMALAQAIIEHILQNIKAKCLFATHYHELTKMQNEFAGIVNYHMECYNSHSGIVFLHRIAKGIAESSFGLEVAKLANVPSSIVKRASELLNFLEQSSSLHPNSCLSFDKNATSTTVLNNLDVYKVQLSMCDKQRTMLEQELAKTRQSLDLIDEINLETMSPKQALDLLWKIKNQT